MTFLIRKENMGGVENPRILERQILGKELSEKLSFTTTYSIIPPIPRSTYLKDIS
jgi:hypothetical protein